MTVEQADPDFEVLPIVEETVSVGRRKVQTGKVSVRTVTDKIDAMVEAALATSEVEIERVPVGREIDVFPDVRTEGDTIIVPVVEEVPVVTTQLVLREEIHIKRRRGEKILEVPVQLLKQRAVISREGHALENERKEIMADTSFAGRTLTAFFDSRADAEEAMVRLNGLGLTDVRISGGEEFAGRTDVDNDRGFWESVSDFFFPDEDRATYAEGMRRGGFLVTVSNVPTERYDEVLDILDDEGSVDLDERAGTWRAEGWSTGSGSAGGAAYAAGSEGGVAGMTDTSVSSETRQAYGTDVPLDAQAERTTGLGEGTVGDLRDGDKEVIPVVQESLRVGKRDVNVGRVRVRSYMVEEPISEDVTLREERVEIERRPVDRALGADETAFTDRTIEAQEHAEEAVVSKDARVVEEIALRRHAEERTETVSDTVRRTEVEVEDERTNLTEAERARLGDDTMRS